MRWGRKGLKKYGVVGTAQETSLLHSTGDNGVVAGGQNVLGKVQAGLDDAETVNRLLANKRLPKGDVFLSLSLNHFEIINLVINKIPDEAVAKVIPFHLSKALDEPLDDFIYDWQITKRKKENLNIVVFLFPRVAYQQLADNFQQHNLTCKTLEPDIYSAAVFLEQHRRIAPDDVCVIVLIWGTSISIGIYEQERFSMVRSIAISLPDEPLSSCGQGEKNEPAMEEDSLKSGADEIELNEITMSQDAPEVDAILADFLITTKLDTPVIEEPAQEQVVAPSPVDDSWQHYFDQLRLELMRTRDYYNSMIKGEPIRKIFVGCNKDLFNEVEPVITESLEIAVEFLPEQAPDSEHYDPCVALGIGAFS